MADLAITAVGDSYYVTTDEVVLEFAQLREHSDGMTAEVTITLTVSGHQHWGRVSLASAVSRSSYIKALGAHDCKRLPRDFDTACFAVVRRERQGQPPQPLVATPATAEQWLVQGIIPRGETSVVYGDGGAGKSLFALGLACAGLTGQPLGRSLRWLVSPLTAVLYCDWESQRADHEARLWGLVRLHGTGEPITGIYHKAMSRPLTDMISSIRRDVADVKADLVIIDSLGPASGAEPESPDAAVRTMNALRSLGSATRLVIAHVSKAQADQDKGARPFGSVFVQNLARSTIEARRDDTAEEGTMVVTYSHRKANRGGLLKPTALRYAFGDDGQINVIHAEPDLRSSGLPVRILDLLKGGAHTVPAMAEELGEEAATVRVTLNRLANRNTVVRLDEASGGGKGNKTLWGLALTRHRANRNTSSA